MVVERGIMFIIKYPVFPFHHEDKEQLSPNNHY